MVAGCPTVARATLMRGREQKRPKAARTPPERRNERRASSAAHGRVSARESRGSVADVSATCARVARATVAL
eukprot:CAMPEP_0206605150 /NCGR_PEP_ID=MMETSP0325_2-20121206/50206_1 /ASSEMBLY_ACC=CAM_ASM_000347 /TAXON_ID=2866 /ORGANISM="Crypthecodinium cohnii, Strain Seligo" /LENGTH=71 /DNA_ID=CAMNT_0054120563 /DNA_START=1 /DNA_END=213 /DNA_ORIENTATION=+